MQAEWRTNEGKRGREEWGLGRMQVIYEVVKQSPGQLWREGSMEFCR